MTDTLRVENLEKYYGKKHVVRSLSFTMQSGECVGLLGPNGAGKTTTFYMICGFIKADGGSVFINDDDVTHKSMHIRSRLGLAYLAQEASIFRRLTVEENIMAILENQRIEKSQRIAEMNRLISRFGLEEVRHQRGYTLSGGERRRTEIARSLAQHPRFLLLDEPFAGIDPKAVYEIKRIIREMQNDGIGVLLTDHNVRDALEITTTSHIISEGRIIKSGKRDELVNDSEARRIYFGEEFRLL